MIIKILSLHVYNWDFIINATTGIKSGKMSVDHSDLIAARGMDSR